MKKQDPHLSALIGFTCDVLAHHVILCFLHSISSMFSCNKIYMPCDDFVFPLCLPRRPYTYLTCQLTAWCNWTFEDKKSHGSM